MGKHITQPRPVAYEEYSKEAALKEPGNGIQGGIIERYKVKKWNHDVKDKGDGKNTLILESIYDKQEKWEN